MPYQFVPHTADVAVRVWADSLPGLFDQAALAFADVTADAAAVDASETLDVAAESPELDVLFHDFLSELVFQFDARRWLAAGADVTVARDAGQWRLAGRLRGEPLSEPRHPVKTLVKAVTYHRLSVTEGEGRWDATVVFDI